MIFFDRMALVDSMLTAFSVWSLNLALLLIKYQRLDLAMFLGYVLGGGLLTKPPGIYAVLTVPTSLAIFDWSARGRQKRILKIFGLWTVAIAITMVIYNILRLGPGFGSLSSRNQDYIFSPLDILSHPLDPLIPHFHDLQSWLPVLLTWPVLLLALGGIVLMVIKRSRPALTVFLWGMVPLLAEMFFFKTFTARYILFVIPLLLLLAAWCVDFLISSKKRFIWLSPVLAILLLPLTLSFNYLLITDPSTAPLPKYERRGYLEDWTAGYGFKEIANFLIQETQKGSVVVGTEGSFGTLPDGLQIYLEKYSHLSSKDNQIVVIGGKATVSAELRTAAQDHRTYFVTNRSRFSTTDESLNLINEYPKAIADDFPQDAILLYQVLPLVRK
jgi:hypothetical protein